MLMKSYETFLFDSPCCGTETIHPQITQNTQIDFSDVKTRERDLALKKLCVTNQQVLVFLATFL